MNEPPHLIEEADLSHAWGRLFLLLMARDQPRWRAPVTVSITGFQDGLVPEKSDLRRALDCALAAQGKFSTRVCAMTIFPVDLWHLEGCPAIGEFTEAYLQRYLPRLQARDSHHNARGVYFERMVAFQGIKQRGDRVTTGGKNQLAHLINLMNQAAGRDRRARRSALQIALLDPVRDHTGSALGGFPCLQQVSVGFEEDDLVLNAYYPSQYVFDRAYGNYLGLSHLGHFLARETGRRLARLNCTVAYPELGDVNKKPLRELQALVERLLAPPAVTVAPAKETRPAAVSVDA